MLKNLSLKLWSFIFSPRVLFFAVLAIITFTAFYKISDKMSIHFQLRHTECISIYSLNTSMISKYGIFFSLTIKRHFFKTN